MAARDSYPFNRWQAVQTLASALLVGNVAKLRAGQDPDVDEGLLDALAVIVGDQTLEPAFIAEALAPPSEADIAREVAREQIVSANSPSGTRGGRTAPTKEQAWHCSR